MSCRTPAFGPWLPLRRPSWSGPRAWVLTIVRNTTFTWLAKNRPKAVLLIGDPQLLEAATAHRDLPRDPEEALIAAADERQSAIQALPHIFREVIVMRDINGMTTPKSSDGGRLPCEFWQELVDFWIVGAAAAAIFFFGGFYSVAGAVPDLDLVHWALVQVRTASIARHANDRAGADLDDPARIQDGARAFATHP